jgi:hypothetical protein
MAINAAIELAVPSQATTDQPKRTVKGCRGVERSKL